MSRTPPQEVAEPEKQGKDETRSWIHLHGRDAEGNWHGGKHGTTYPTKDDTPATWSKK